MLGTLYIVATPIGNLEDITFRAVKTLKEVDLILAEDTRVTKKLLGHYDIKTNLVSYHQHSSDSKKLQILSKLIEGKNLALVSDAGTPGISDPGNELINYVLERSPKMQIVPVPGPSAITAALSVSGFRTDRYIFLGFLPKKKRTKLFGWLKESKTSFAFYESPNRLVKTLEVLSEYFGPETRVLVARELTKLHESLYRGTIKEVQDQLPEMIKGEVVVVVEGP